MHFFKFKNVTPKTSVQEYQCDMSITILPVTAPVILLFLLLSSFAHLEHIAFFGYKRAPTLDMAILFHLPSKVYSNRKEITKFYNTKCIQVGMYMYVSWGHL